MLNEKEYLLNAKLPHFKKKVEMSKRIVDEMLTKSTTPYIAWSGGKDSTALVYLITQDMKYKDMLIFCEKDDCDFPDEKEYVEKVIQKYNLNCKIYEPEESMWKYLVDNKVFLMKDIHKKSNEITKKFFTEVIKRFINDYNPDGVFMGLRSDESKIRYFNTKKRGCLYYANYNKMWHCNPLSYWSFKDVFSYLLINDIPILPLYTKSSIIKDTENIRKSWWIPTGASIRYGEVLFLKIEYPELFYKLEQVYKDIAGAV